MASFEQNWKDAYEALLFVKSRMQLGSPIALGVEAAEQLASPVPVGQLMEGVARPPTPFIPVVNQVQGALKIVQGHIAKQAMNYVRDEDAYRKSAENAKNLPSAAANEINVNRMARDAMRSFAGNCGEQSALCFVHLRGRGVFPIDIAYWGNFDGAYGGHAFVIIGRAAKSAIADPDSWGESCVICDPQKTGQIFKANMASHYFDHFGTHKYQLFLRLEARTSYSDALEP